MYFTPGEILASELYHYTVYIATVRQPAYLDGLLVVQERGTPIRCILTMNPTQEVQLDSML